MQPYLPSNHPFRKITAPPLPNFIPIISTKKIARWTKRNKREKQEKLAHVWTFSGHMKCHESGFMLCFSQLFPPRIDCFSVSIDTRSCELCQRKLFSTVFHTWNWINNREESFLASISSKIFFFHFIRSSLNSSEVDHCIESGSSEAENSQINANQMRKMASSFPHVRVKSNQFFPVWRWCCRWNACCVHCAINLSSSVVKKVARQLPERWGKSKASFATKSDNLPHITPQLCVTA